MKRLGQTHLSHMLTLSRTYFVFYPFFLPRTVSKHQALLPNFHSFFLLLPSHMQPHFPFSQHSPQMLPSHWSTVNPMAWHLCRVCKWQNLWEASCWLLSCRFCGSWGHVKCVQFLFFFPSLQTSEWSEWGRETKAARVRGLETKSRETKKKKEKKGNTALVLFKLLTVSLENWQKLLSFQHCCLWFLSIQEVVTPLLHLADKWFQFSN